MAEGHIYRKKEQEDKDDDSSTTESSSKKTDDEHCDTPLTRAGKSFSEHEMADESVPRTVNLDSFGDKKRPRQKDDSKVRSPPSKNPTPKKTARRRRSSSFMDVDPSDVRVGHNPNRAAGSSAQIPGSSHQEAPDLLASKKSPIKSYDPKLRPGVTSSSLGAGGLCFSPNRSTDQPSKYAQGSEYNPNLRPGVTELSKQYVSGTVSMPSLSPNKAGASGSHISPVHHLSPGRKALQRQVSDDGVEGDQEDECPDDDSCTSPNRSQKKTLRMKKTQDGKLYFRSTIEPIHLDACEFYRIDNRVTSVDVVALLRERAREQLQYKTEAQVRQILMHLICFPEQWLETVVEQRTLESLNLGQLLLSKFVVSPSKGSLSSKLKANADPRTGAVPKYQPILYSDSPFSTGDEAEQGAGDRSGRRQSPKKKADSTTGNPKFSAEEVKNLERRAERLIQDCTDSKSGASGSGHASYC